VMDLLCRTTRTTQDAVQRHFSGRSIEP
jgi:hypothetical protein